MRLYRLRPEAFASLRDWLGEVEEFWGEQLRSLKARAASQEMSGTLARAGDQATSLRLHAQAKRKESPPK